MKIGITGNPGSGKTTFATYLYQYLPNCYKPDTDHLYHSCAEERMMDKIGWKFVTARDDEKIYQSIVEELEEKGIVIKANVPIKEKASFALSEFAFSYLSTFIHVQTPKNCDFVIIDFYLLPYLCKYYDFDKLVLLDLKDDIRYQRVLYRMMKNENKAFSEEEKIKRINDMVSYEKKLNNNLNLINYDTVLNNLGDIDELRELAKQYALDILKQYSKTDVLKMMQREIIYINGEVERCSRLFFYKLTDEQIYDIKNDLKEKIRFLYQNKLIVKDDLKKLFSETNNIKINKR